MNREKVPSFADYPFCLPALRHLRALPFHPRVTFIIGENGSGKSTLLEAIAVAYGLNAEGGSKNFDFASQATHSPLYDYLRLVKGAKKPRDSFFLRAESFYNVATQIDRLDAEHSFGPPLKLAYGGRSLHQQSHGEAFLALLTVSAATACICWTNPRRPCRRRVRWRCSPGCTSWSSKIRS